MHSFSLIRNHLYETKIGTNFVGNFRSIFSKNKLTQRLGIKDDKNISNLVAKGLSAPEKGVSYKKKECIKNTQLLIYNQQTMKMS